MSLSLQQAGLVCRNAIRRQIRQAGLMIFYIVKGICLSNAESAAEKP